MCKGPDAEREISNVDGAQCGKERQGLDHMRIS